MSLLFGERNNAKIILPYSTEKEAIKKIKEGILERENYKAYSLDEELNIIEGYGQVRNFHFFNYSSRRAEDNVKKELYFKSSTEMLSPNIEWKSNSLKWWTQSYEEVIKVREDSINALVKIYEEKIHILKSKINLFEKKIIIEKI